MRKMVLSMLVCSAFNLFAQHPRSYIAQYAAKPVEIDGVADESWDETDWSDLFIDIEGDKQPKYETKVKMLWDCTYLYFYAELEEPHVWGDITTRDQVIFYNNDFEIFIDPDGDTHNYMEFEMNALNTVWDLFITKPYRNHPRVIDNWDIKGLKTAVAVDGTINDASDKDNGWSVEIAMPWSALLEAVSGGIPVDQYWRINFSRVNWDFELHDGIYSRKKDRTGQFFPEYNWVWSPQGVINMHEPEHWGFVYFASENTKFAPDYDELLRRKLYETYRSLHERKLSLSDTDYFAVNFQQEKIAVHYQEHMTGWNIWLTSPKTGKRIVIKEDGQSFILNN